MADEDDEIYEDFYDEEEDYEDEDEEDYDEEDDIEEDDEETFEPDEELGDEGEGENEGWEPPVIPELLTPTDYPLGFVTIMPTGEAVVDLELDFKDIDGVYQFEIKVSPLG